MTTPHAHKSSLILQVVFYQRYKYIQKYVSVPVKRIFHHIGLITQASLYLPYQLIATACRYDNK